MRILLIIALLFINSAYARFIPVGSDNNALYYRIGGGDDFVLPPVTNTDTINLNSAANLSIGNSCYNYNPALSIRNSFNDLKDEVTGVENDLVTNATGSIIQLPKYWLAKRAPTLFALINDRLFSSNQKLKISTKDCLTVKDQIAQGKNPYEDWGVIAVNDQWKQKLSLMETDPNHNDMNDAKKDIDRHYGDDGVSWVAGKNNQFNETKAGGKNQPPIHVIADTAVAGFNTMLRRRNTQSNDPAPSNEELAQYFPRPKDAAFWITNVVGDQIITTCHDNNCKSNQGSVVGHGLLPQITDCRQDNENCIDAIKEKLGNLVSGRDSITKDNLEKVSTSGIVITPDAIASIQGMDRSQQGIIVNKLAQEIAIQRVIDKALIAKNILMMGSQVPVIAANHPAQVVIGRSITNLDNDVRSIVFESQIRKEMMSNTLSKVIDFNLKRQERAMSVPPAQSNSEMLDDGSLPNKQKRS